MNYQQVLALIQQFIVANGNNEITANVLRPILEAILAQPNELIGDSDDLQTNDKTNLVAAINEVLNNIAPQIGSDNTKIHYLSLDGIDPNLPELSKIAKAVEIYGPFTCSVSEQMVFKTITTIGDNGSIVTRYYRLIKNLVSIGGTSGPAELAILPFWFMPDGEGLHQNPEEEGIIAELGNIGVDNVWDVFNLGNAGEAWDMEIYRFVRATQNGEIKLWAFTGLERFYGGPDMIVDPDIYEAFESDFFDITNEPPTPNPDFTFHKYDDIDELIIRQAEQTPGDLILVLDAVDDSDITFEAGETRRQAMYRLKSTVKTGNLSDYLLVAVPYGNGGGDPFTPSDYDLDDFNNESVDPFVRESELGDVAKSNNYNDLDNLPDLSAFDNVDTYPTVGDFPAVGEADVFYIDDSTGKLYRWNGTGYSVVAGDLALGETSQTAYRGDRGKIAYDHSQAPHAPADAQKNSDITQTEITNSLGYIPENLERKVSNLLTPDDLDYPTTKAVADAIATKQPKDLTYPTITAMLADQSNQLEGVVIRVTDASADTRITFPTGASQIAYYQKLATSTATLADDYVLNSAPFGNVETGLYTIPQSGTDIGKLDLSNPFGLDATTLNNEVESLSIHTGSVVGGNITFRSRTTIRPTITGATEQVYLSEPSANFDNTVTYTIVVWKEANGINWLMRKRS